MIREWEKWWVPTPYSESVAFPRGSCTYRDASSYYVAYDNGEIVSADILHTRGTEGLDKLWYYNSSWHIERQYRSNDQCYCEMLASVPWLYTIADCGCCYAMREKTLKSICKSLNTSPMAETVLRLVTNSLLQYGFNAQFFYYTDCRPKTPLLKAWLDLSQNGATK